METLNASGYRNYFNFGWRSNSTACVFRSRPGAKLNRMKSLTRYHAIPVERRMLSDLIYFGRKAQLVGGEWAINVLRVARARRLRQPAFSWFAIIIRALAVTASRRAELRTYYMPAPWPHFYVHPTNVASVIIERAWQGRTALFFDQIHAPEAMSIAEIDRVLRGLRNLPINNVGGFRRMLRIARCPLLLRRFLLALVLYGSGRLRSRYLGTIAFSQMPVSRAKVMQSTGVAPCLYYGVADAAGNLPVQFLFDHRVLDGAAAHRFIVEFEAILNGEIVMELQDAAV